jgi:tryptophan halogenase
VTPGRSIQRVVVAGGGITAWSAAAALRRHIPSLQVTVISIPVPADALADRMMSTLPSIAGFHADVGLTEADTIIGARSSLRVGTLFEGWARDLPSYVHAYGSYGEPIDGIAFHQLWLRAGKSETVAPYELYSKAAQLGRKGRIGRPSKVDPVGYGLHLSLERHHALMRDYALHLGAFERRCQGFEVTFSEDGFIDALRLDDGQNVSADLFVDCTGPASLIRGTLDQDFEEWGRWLPCDRLAFAEHWTDGEPVLLDRVVASATGWTWTASSHSRSSTGIAYASAFGTSNDPPGDAVTIDMRQGRWANAWVRNCVAIGDAAVVVEPLEWTNLHLAHSQIDRLIEMMPGADCAPIELIEYNRQCGDEAARVRDFICMHYATATRDEPFWKEARSMEPPPSLAHTLALFSERGRLPHYEEETFSRDNWLAVLLGQGFRPRRIDPLADIISADHARAELERSACSVRNFVEAQPSYADYLSTLGKRSIQ